MPAPAARCLRTGWTLAPLVAFATRALAQSMPTAADWRADLQVGAREMPRQHKNLYHAMSPAAFDSAVRALDARIPTLARHQVIVELQRIVALVGDGHTNVYPTRDAAIGFRELPIALYWFRDGLFVRQARADHARLLGARILSIGGVPTDEAIARVRPLIGRDNEMGTRFFAPALLAMPEVLHAVGLAGAPDSARVELSIDGRRETLWLRPAGPVRLMAADTDKEWTSRPGWVDARTETPLWLAAPDSVFRLTMIPDSRALYTQINQVGDTPNETLEQFAGRLRATIDSARPERLVLDLRLDRGGNGDLLPPLVRALIASPVDRRGGLFVLVGRSTWSASQFLLNDLEKWTNAIFVGEPSASKGNVYGDSKRIVLPHSGVTVRVSSYWHQAWAADDARPWTEPELAAEPTFADYAAGRDPALALALGWTPTPPLATQLLAAYASHDVASARTRLAAFRADSLHRWLNAERIVDSVGSRLWRGGARTDAVAAFTLAAESYPSSVNAHLLLGEVLAATGATDDARRSYERARALDLTNEQARAALAALAALARP